MHSVAKTSAGKLRYNPTAFQVLIHGRSDGFTRLWEMGRLDLAVEFLVAFDDRFAPLFTDDERRASKERLAL